MLDYSALARVRKMLEDESRMLRMAALHAQGDDRTRVAMRRATCAEACFAAEQAIYHVLDVLYVELDDKQAEEAMKDHA
jgi:hypothetical protein